MLIDDTTHLGCATHVKFKQSATRPEPKFLGQYRATTVLGETVVDPKTPGIDLTDPLMPSDLTVVEESHVVDAERDCPLGEQQGGEAEGEQQGQ